MTARVRTPTGYRITDSTNVRYVLWDSKTKTMFVWFVTGGCYLYKDVPYQRAVACARAKSVGKYLNQKIKPNYEAVKLSR